MNNQENSSGIMNLEKCGVNVQAALERFMGKEAIYKKCLVKLIDDKNLEKLNQAMESGDIKESDDAAHTLAGIVGNLSLDPLHAAIQTLRTQIKDNKLDKDQLKKINDLYSDIMAVIKSIV